MLPGKGPVTKPTWPPRDGNSSLTAAETSRSVGSALSGRNGSSRALRSSVGTRMRASQRLGARARPVVVGVAEAVQRRGDHVVELAQRARAAHAPPRRRGPGWRASFASALALERREEMARVEAREAAPERVARGHEVERRADRRGARRRSRRAVVAALAQPLRERVAAERDAHGVERRAARALARARRSDPVDLRRCRPSDRRAAAGWARRCSRGSACTLPRQPRPRTCAMSMRA